MTECFNLGRIFSVRNTLYPYVLSLCLFFGPQLLTYTRLCLYLSLHFFFPPLYHCNAVDVSVSLCNSELHGDRTKPVRPTRSLLAIGTGPSLVT